MCVWYVAWRGGAWPKQHAPRSTAAAARSEVGTIQGGVQTNGSTRDTVLQYLVYCDACLDHLLVFYRAHPPGWRGIRDRGCQGGDGTPLSG